MKLTELRRILSNDLDVSNYITGLEEAIQELEDLTSEQEDTITSQQVEMDHLEQTVDELRDEIIHLEHTIEEMKKLLFKCFLRH